MRALFAALALAATAATGDPLPIVPKVAETFSGSLPTIVALYNQGISVGPNQVFTRTHVASGEKQLWMGGNFLGQGVNPFYLKAGILRIRTAPMPASVLPIIAQKADLAVAAGSITAKQAANLKAVRWSSGLLASKKCTGPGYYGFNGQLPKGKGLWPAFYLWDDRLNLEIDVLEAVGDKPNRFYFSTHSPWGGTGSVKVDMPFELAKGYHEYGVLVRGKDLVLYVDRIERARLPMPTGGNTAANPPCWRWQIHTAVGGNWLENPAYGVNNVPVAGSRSEFFINEVLAP